MARSRFDNLDIEKQETILAAAAEEFAERGYEAASLNRIAQRSGSSKGTLYYYFEDKADLFATVMERASEAGAPGMLRVDELTAVEYWDTLRRTARESLRLVQRDEWYLKIGQAFFRLLEEPAAREVTTRALERNQRMFRSFLLRGQELGVVRTDLPLPMLMEMLTGLSMGGKRWLLRHWDDLTEREVAELTEAFVDALRDMLDARNEGWER